MCGSNNSEMRPRTGSRDVTETAFHLLASECFPLQRLPTVQSPPGLQNFGSLDHLLFPFLNFLEGSVSLCNFSSPSILDLPENQRRHLSSTGKSNHQDTLSHPPRQLSPCLSPSRALRHCTFPVTQGQVRTPESTLSYSPISPNTKFNAWRRRTQKKIFEF